MPSKHHLSVNIPETNNVSVFRIIDTSIYADGLEIKCAKLQITSPGYTIPVEIDVTNFANNTVGSFNIMLNACTLGLLANGCNEQDNLPSIPDGIYKIRYSVSPNDKVYVDYYFLRMSQTYNIYNQELCKLELGAYEPSVEVKARLNELSLIKSYFEAAKIKAEDCHEPNLAMELFLYAKQRLDSYRTGCNNC